mgnify:CR=1 FL=1
MVIQGRTVTVDDNRSYQTPAGAGEGSTLFVDNPQFPMDNNAAERILRPLVLGRKKLPGKSC